MALGAFGGLIIRDDEIIDGLRRANLPSGIQTTEAREAGPRGAEIADCLANYRRNSSSFSVLRWAAMLAFGFSERSNPCSFDSSVWHTVKA
jgi:hypothetical protein